jgi:hypothetical protein
MASLGAVRYGHAGGASFVEVWFGRVRRGLLRQVGRGMVVRGEVRFGLATQVRCGVGRCGLVLC